MMSEQQNDPEQNPQDDQLQGQGQGQQPSAEQPGDDPQEVELSPEAAQIIEHLQQEIEDAVEARKRALADFKNFQRRAAENELRAIESGTSRVIRALIPVLDQFDFALQQDTSKLTVEQLLGGVKLVQQELIKTLQNFNLEIIEPQRGDAFDPNIHEAMARQPSDDVPDEAILSIYQPGYRMGDTVLRPAKVVLAAGPAGSTESTEPDAGTAGTNE